MIKHSYFILQFNYFVFFPNHLKMDEKIVADETFFKTLKNYSPIFYLGKGSAIFLINSKWQTSFITVVSSCIAYGISIWFLFKSGYLMK